MPGIIQILNDHYINYLPQLYVGNTVIPSFYNEKTRQQRHVDHVFHLETHTFVPRSVCCTHYISIAIMYCAEFYFILFSEALSEKR